MDEIETTLTISRTELTCILHRLEAATSRLEDMAAALVEPPKANGALSTEAPKAAPTEVAAPTPISVPPPAPKLVAEPVPQVVEDFDNFIADSVQKYVKLSDGIEGVVAEQVQ